ncbi:MAG: serine hydroxymethyltransferase [Anaerolineae bacterium]|jgi:glycine hydroxymethyltransferase|nr:serine hydroxymethyltransferase [Anaerolineae bacterium]MBT7190034.1 serine hydroxymethyltransferase [Anaerolineae bacterium]MBT7989690.1 serine hydroxymethyltransferase [Anaerolineae bacterium]
MNNIKHDDPQILALILQEAERIENTIDLVASETHMPKSILEEMGSVLNHKTIEGYPGKRYHAGCEHVDVIENLAIDRMKELFGAEHANVQPHTGSSANFAVYFSVLDIGDKVLAMELSHGGHLTHGHFASMTSKSFSFQHYEVDLETELIDYEALAKKAEEFKPKMIVAGASSYPRLIDYEKFSKIAKSVDAYFFVDMAHIAGLVAAKLIPSPVEYADFVSFTTFKTMMGGRGGVILCKKEYADAVDKAVFPGTQGTTAVSNIAGKATIAKLAQESNFIEVQRKTMTSAKLLAKNLAEKGYRIVGGGTDTHQVVVDVTAKGLSGSQAENTLESIGIITNRNYIPKDTGRRASGLRLGTGPISVRGIEDDYVVQIANIIDKAIMNYENEEVLDGLKKDILSICKEFPVYK